MDQRSTDLGAVSLTSLTWGEVDDQTRPLAVLLHGFPDTAHTWRHVGPALARSGYRVVAPFTRGYAPSGLATDGVHHPTALMADALALHEAYGGDGRAVLVGHDWGAITANGLAASEESPYRRVVSLAVPPFPTMNPTRADAAAWARILPRQAALSWYTVFNQLPGLPERTAARLVARLWRTWSPGYDAAEDLAHVAAALPDRPHRSAAFGYYRDTARRFRLPDPYRRFARDWTAGPRVPLLYLHGADDGCLDVRWAARAAARLPAECDVAVVEGAGHFLQLERPAEVADRVLTFLEQP